jgi:hypothetical protein
MPSFTDNVARWNRRLHYYVGLYLLALVWLFSLTGLLLNHQWGFADFWPGRNVTTFERSFEPPRGARELERAADLLRQLDISGEIGATTTRGPAEFEVQVARPGTTFQIKADLVRLQASVQRTSVNHWGIFRTLHTFSGMPRAAAASERDWLPTKIWSVLMDVVSLGLIFLVLSSLYMWWALRTKRVAGFVALALGIVSCGFFVVGLRVLL